MKKYAFLFILLAQSVQLNCQTISKYGVKTITEINYYVEKLALDSAAKLVDLSTVKNAKLDIRYATTNNFTGVKQYNQPMAYGAIQLKNALQKIAIDLEKSGLGLIIFDAYRPYSVTVNFYKNYGNTQFVASPYKGSRHNKGFAVDVSLYNLKTGKPLAMPTPYDDFTEKAHPNYSNLPEEIIKNREILITTMQNHGFTVFHTEWWHFDFDGWEKYLLLDLTFEQLKKYHDNY